MLQGLSHVTTRNIYPPHYHLYTYEFWRQRRGAAADTNCTVLVTNLPAVKRGDVNALDELRGQLMEQFKGFWLANDPIHLQWARGTVREGGGGPGRWECGWGWGAVVAGDKGSIVGV
jgi:hypothetical protein